MALAQVRPGEPLPGRGVIEPGDVAGRSLLQDLREVRGRQHGLGRRGEVQVHLVNAGLLQGVRPPAQHAGDLGPRVPVDLHR